MYIGSIEGIFYCLDALTGEILWEYETQSPFRSAPAVVSGKVLVSSTDGNLYCFGIDPQTYEMKAQNYLDNRVYDKAEEFLLKAKEYAQLDEDTKEIENLLDYVTSQMPDYQKRLERLSEAETLMDTADKIIWDKEFKRLSHNSFLRIYSVSLWGILPWALPWSCTPLSALSVSLLPFSS